jgi:hypothetical protein
MSRIRNAVVGMLVIVGVLAAAQPAMAGVRIGLGIGLPIYPWAPPYYSYYPYRPIYYYPPPPVYVQPSPVYLQPAPAYVQPPPAPQARYETSPPPNQALPVTPVPLPQSGVTQTSASPVADIERNLQLLADADERVRSNAVMQLGRMKAERALDPLAATLAGDRSATVREAAARALGLIGSPKALPALRGAALNDSDRDVRHSAEFAIEVVQAGR